MSFDPRSRSMNGAEYLQNVLGDVLAKALSSVARERPQDPVAYLSDFLRKAAKTSKKDDDHDSGHGDDQEAPSNFVNSHDSVSTLELSRREQKQSHKGLSERQRKVFSGSTGPSTTSSLDSQRSSNQSKDRGRGRGRKSRKRKTTAQSEPIPTMPLSSKEEEEYLSQFRSRSLPADRLRSTPGEAGRKYDRDDPRRLFSRRVPLAALSWDEYRKKRGLKLPPMKNAPKFESGHDHDDRRRDLSLDTGRRAKNTQLTPLTTPRETTKRQEKEQQQHVDTFDWQKHVRKNKKMLRENKIIANMQ